MKILNAITLVAVITVNALANILPINGVTTGGVSARYDNYFTSAGFTFSIWSVIYLGLTAFVIYQFFSKFFKPRDIGYFFVLNGIANISWILAWHYGYLTMIVFIMFLILLTLIKINLRISGSSWWVRFPFQIYLGWICVATIANIAVYFKFLDVAVLGIEEVHWGIILAIIAGGLGLIILFRKGWTVATLAISWGLWGIFNKQNDLGQEETYQVVCLAIIIVLVLSTLFQRSLKKKFQLALN